MATLTKAEAARRAKAKKRKPKFEIYEDLVGGWRWRLLGANSEVVASSEAYTRSQDAWRSARRVKVLAADAGMRSANGSFTIVPSPRHA